MGPSADVTNAPRQKPPQALSKRSDKRVRHPAKPFPAIGDRSAAQAAVDAFPASGPKAATTAPWSPRPLRAQRPIARGLAGPGRGYIWTGFLGGLISSTNVTWTFSRLSGRERHLAAPLALGVVAACTVMYVRVFTALLVLERRMAMDLWPFLALPGAIGAGMVAYGLWRNRGTGYGGEGARNPLELGAALQMAALFQGVMFAVYWAREWGGGAGLVTSGAILGLTDVDALTVSMARAYSDPAARMALLAGVTANSVLKMGVAVTTGAGRFRRLAGIGLGLLALASSVGLLWRDTGR